MSAPVQGRLDAGGRLIEADGALAALHARAGGEPGGILAVPQLAQVARLAQRLRVAVSRGVVAADGDRDVDLWVRAAPEDGGVRLAIVAWTERPALPGPPPAAERDFLRAAGEWTWETDAALKLVGVWPAAPGAGFVGQPLTRLFALLPAADDALPIVEAVAEQRDFTAQQAVLRTGPGGRFMLDGKALFDGAGRFHGFRGTAARLIEVEPVQSVDGAFGERLGAALKTPLDRIIAAADAIGARADGPLKRDYAGYAEDIASAGRHLLALIGDLVDLSAIERPDFRPEPEPLDLADLARRAGGLLALRALEREVRVDAPAIGESLAAVADYRRVLQILVNLIGNAIRYSPAGAAVTIRGARDGGSARLTIADRGKGIAIEDQQRIFDKFERVDPNEPGGTGLGLYIARRLARAMGGDLTVESAPEEGARFTLSLPVG